MRLTQRQELLLGRYLQEVERHLDSLGESDRGQIIDRLRLRLVKQLSAPAETTLTDEEARRVLARFGAPAAVARQVLSAQQPPTTERLTREPARWLGVCAAWAARLDRDVRPIRLAAVFAGLLTGPLALMLYLVLYFEMYFTSDAGELPRIEKWKLVKSVAGTVAASAAFFAGSKAALMGMNYTYARLLQKDPPFLGGWAWLDAYGVPLFVLLLVCSVPLAVLGGLPLPNQWDATAKRLVQAALAVYALVICLGIASALTGTILVAVEVISGSHASPAELLGVIKRIT